MKTKNLTNINSNQNNRGLWNRLTTATPVGRFTARSPVSLVTTLFALAGLCSLAALSATAGGVFITGHDPDYHGTYSVGAQHIIQRAIAYVTFNIPNPRILLVTDLRNPGGDQIDSRLGMTAAGFSFEVADYGSGAAGVLDLHTVVFSNYDAVVVASDYGGWLEQDELDILNARSADILDFINSGNRGLVAFAEAGNRGNGTGTTHDRFGYLPFIVSQLSLSQSEFGFTVTQAGLDLGLTAADINGNASHNVFTATGGLDIIDQDPAGDILSLATRLHITPQGVTLIYLTPQFATNHLGTAHTVCATVTSVTNGVANPVPGTTVTFNVTNGPNATVHGTSVTDSNGVACFTYVGAGGVGADTIDASFVDSSGVRQSTFATKVWVAPPNAPNLLKNLIIQGTNVSIGETFSYEISFDTFSLTAAAVALRVVDDLPSQVDFVSVTTNGALSATYDPGLHEVVWDFGTWPPLAAGPTNVVTVRLNANAVGGATIVNQASITASNLPPVTTRDRNPRCPTCPAGVVVASNSPPVAVCQSLTVRNDLGLCSATVTPDQVGGGSYDPEGTAVTLTLTPPGPYAVGSNAVTLTVTDTNGLSATCAATIVVVDAEPPVITCPANIIVDFTAATGTVVTFSASAVDQCPGPVAIVYAPPPGSVFPIGTNTVAVIATDAAGNSNSCSFQITARGARGVKQECLDHLVALRCAADSLKTNANVTPNGAPWNYDDGYVLDDGPGTPPGLTWYWGYTDPSQVPGDGTIVFHRTVVTNCTTILITDAFALNGVVPPQPLYYGTYQGPVPGGPNRPVISDTPSHSTTTLTTNTVSLADKHEGEELDDAIAHLTASLDPSLWLDETHLQRLHGETVFQQEKHAVQDLVELLKDKDSGVPPAMLQQLIACILRVDRLLAVVAIDEATAAGVNSRKIDGARKQLADGDLDADQGKFAQAVDGYRNAWDRVRHAKIDQVDRLANGTVQLQILGFAGESYVIQASRNLNDWITLDTRVAGPDGVVIFEETNPSVGPMRFYELLAP